MTIFEKYLQEQNIVVDKPIINDINRLTRGMDLEKIKVSEKFNVFNKLARIYLQIHEHVSLLEGAGKSHTLYHEEMSILEGFIRHLIEQFQFINDFDKLIQKQNDGIGYNVDSELGIDNDFVEIEDIETEIGSEEVEEDPTDDLFIKEDL